MQGLKLAVFDCDGTLVDSQHAINSCMGQAFESLNLQPPPISQVRRVVGLPLARAIEILADDPDAPVPDLVAAYSTAWQHIRTGGGLDEPLFEGTRELLDELLTQNWILGVATGKSRRGLDATLAHHGLNEHFVTLQTSDVARGKPDPDMLHRAMMDTGADVENTVMIGDTTYDIEMAAAAGVKSIGVSWGYHEPELLLSAGASAVVETNDELRMLL